MRTVAASLAAAAATIATSAWLLLPGTESVSQTGVQVREVGTPAALQAALERARPGGTIRLKNRDWPPLEIRDRRYDGDVVITGPARLRGPVTILGSRHIRLAGVTVDGGRLVLGADSTAITIAGSEFTRCPGICVQLGRDGDQLTTGVSVDGNVFHDSTDHFIGLAGNGVTIHGNRFDRTDRPGCEDESQKHEGSGKKCPEHIRVLGGGPWLITSNRFGDAAENGPLVRVFPQSEYPLIHDLGFVNNLLRSSRRNQSGIAIEGSQRGRYPPGIQVVNNTGWTSENCVGLGSSWALAPLELRPLVVNNVCRFEGVDQCLRGRFLSNVTEQTRGSCAGLIVGPAQLDEELRPTSASVLVIDQASAEHAPALDHFGLPRVGPPDRGAIEAR